MLVGLLIGALLAAAAALLLWHRFGAEATGKKGLRGEVARLSEDLEASKRLLGQADRLSSIGMLAASVAHEVRNPLVSVRTFVQLLPERIDDEDFRTNFRELALGEIDRICVLVNDLLAFARPGGYDVHSTDVNGILAQTSRLLDAEAKKHSVHLAIQAAPELPPVPIDEARVKQVILNLTLNAIQASSGGGEVAIAARIDHRRSSSYFQIEVRDSGVGIQPDDIERIFDPFFTTKERGNGLGLFIAQRIVRDHGGRIDVTSTPGVGTVFVLSFPLPREEDCPAPEATETKQDGHVYDRIDRPVSHG